ncbi:hypothetical protein [Verrucomicrobium sp. BvORR034]|uniref:hypothetical protein n=1 Tax=Verrucomicrobium sp. BvORR034 TaxID=1396418 RepID=UPI000A5F5E31|nr:hypothetical protein [Verrucomicrobium sp. BvORR034]
MGAGGEQLAWSKNAVSGEDLTNVILLFAEVPFASIREQGILVGSKFQQPSNPYEIQRRQKREEEGPKQNSQGEEVRQGREEEK